MKAQFHGGPLDGLTHHLDDWDEPGTPYSAALADDGEIVARWHYNVANPRQLHFTRPFPLALYLYDGASTSLESGVAQYICVVETNDADG